MILQLFSFLQGLINIAVEELCESANALLAPVRLGIARPTAPFNLSTSESELSVKELFSAEPLMPKTVSSATATSSRSRSRTRSLTVENLRSSRSQSNSEQRVASINNAPSEQDMPPMAPEDVSLGIQPPVANNQIEMMQQDHFENDDSMGGVIENANAEVNDVEPGPNDNQVGFSMINRIMF